MSQVGVLRSDSEATRERVTTRVSVAVRGVVSVFTRPSLRIMVLVSHKQRMRAITYCLVPLRRRSANKITSNASYRSTEYRRLQLWILLVLVSLQALSPLFELLISQVPAGIRCSQLFERTVVSENLTAHKTTVQYVSDSE